MSQIQSITLNDGVEIPLLGFGTGTKLTKKEGVRALDQELVANVVLAVKKGFLHLDGAEVYRNEAELGQAIKDCGVSRDKLFITTKISGTTVQDTQISFDESMKRLQLDYVDMYLVHAPYFAKSKGDLQAKWAEMEKIQASGRARSIGVSNFLQHDLEAVLETAKVVPSINQIEFHPYLQHGDLLPFHKKHGIATAAYGPLVAATKAAPGPVDTVYKKLSHKYGVTPGEIALRWCMDQDVVALTTSWKAERMEQYLKAGSFKLTPEEINEISELGKTKHYRVFWRPRFDEADTR